MLSVGIDLHKDTITFCALDQDRAVVKIRTLPCRPTDRLRAAFAALGPFRAVVEATASYHWFVELIEPLAREVVLAHPGRLRVIAETAFKSDKLDAKALAELLAADMVPRAYRPTPRQRQHRALVRHRQYLQRQRSALRVKVRRVVSDDDADRKDLFTRAGLEYLAGLELLPADRFTIEQMLAQLNFLREQLAAIRRRLHAFAAEAPAAEAEHRRLVRTVPGVGEVTAEVVLAELGDPTRFGSAKQVAAYAGLAPGRRESAGKAREMGITKRGSGLLRWALVEAAWRLVRLSTHWRGVYGRLKARRGARRAIVAVARRLLGVLVALIRAGQEYREPAPAPAA